MGPIDFSMNLIYLYLILTSLVSCLERISNRRYTHILLFIDKEGKKNDIAWDADVGRDNGNDWQLRGLPTFRASLGQTPCVKYFCDFFVWKERESPHRR